MYLNQYGTIQFSGNSPLTLQQPVHYSLWEPAKNVSPYIDGGQHALLYILGILQTDTAG